MDQRQRWRAIVFSDLGILILLALAWLLMHYLINLGSGWHRDELATLDNARHLAWGYVAYPPLSPFMARVALVMFGAQPAGVRLVSGLAPAIAMVLTGLMARELGGRRGAQVVAAIAAGIGGLAMAAGAIFEYVAFDYLWWVLIAYLIVRLLKSDDPRWWLGIGAAIGLGAMTKYTIAFYVAALGVGLLLTPARRYLRSPWLWAGALVALLICLPNLIWQAQHGFISLRFLSSIHERDVRIGRASSYLPGQLLTATNPLTLPIWVAGLYWYLLAPAGRRYRMLGWMWVVTFLLFLLSQGRDYYLAPAYPMLFAAGAVWGQGWLATLSPRWAGAVRVLVAVALVLGTAVSVGIATPVWPPGSPMFTAASEINSDLREEVGWPELVAAVHGVYAALPADERAHTAILTANYGEAGAIDLYGPAYGLPEAISGVNSYWAQGYGDPPPETLIVLGFPRSWADTRFESCAVGGQIPNLLRVENEESEQPDILVCRRLRQSWPAFWNSMQYFG